MTQTPVLIMAVPWEPERTRRAVELARATDGEIVWDSTMNAMGTFRDLLRAAAEKPSGVLLLEDDVYLAPDWRARVEAVIAERPRQVCQFFAIGSPAGGERPGVKFTSNLCVYLPAGMAADLLPYSYEFVERYPHYATGNDFVIRYWLRDHKLTYWLEQPSLVQHESWKSSINSRRPRNRRSHTFDTTTQE